MGEQAEMEAARNGEDENGGSRSRFWEGVLLTLSPVVAYSIAYVFEAGYASHFGYPASLVEVDFRIALVCWGILLGLVIGFGGLVYTLAAIIKAHAGVLWVVWGMFIGLPAALGFYVWFGLPPEAILYRLIAVPFFGVALVQIWLLLLRPLFEYDGPVSSRWWKALEDVVAAEESSRDGIVRDSLLDVFSSEFQRAVNFVLLAAGLGVVLLVGHWVGKVYADKRSSFLVFAEEPTTVVLRRYGDHLVTASLNLDGGTVEGDYVILSLAHPDRVWHVREVGPLMLESRGAEVTADPQDGAQDALGNPETDTGAAPSKSDAPDSLNAAQNAQDDQSVP